MTSDPNIARMNAAMAAQYRAQHPHPTHPPHPPHPSHPPHPAHQQTQHAQQQQQNHHQQLQQQQQQQQRMQQGGSHKRGPPPHMQGMPRPEDRQRIQQLQAQQERLEAERAHREKTRALRPTDKTIPPGIEDLIIGDGVEQYNKIRDVERQLDAMMMRKRLDLIDPVEAPIDDFIRLKIWISNTVENQPWQTKEMDENAFDFGDGTDATYRVKIEGRVIEDEDLKSGDDDENEEGGNGLADEDDDDAMDIDSSKKDQKRETTNSATQKSKTPPVTRLKLSQLFKKITIDFDRDRNLQPDGMTQIEWKKPSPPNPNQPTTEFDSLEFERKSDENINITINLYRNEREERHHLSPELSTLLDTDTASKSAAIEGIWEYIRLTGLQKDDARRLINCDDTLKAIFKTDHLRFPDLPRHIDQHLSPLPPLPLHYTIRTDPDYAANPNPTIYTLHLLPPPSLTATAPRAAPRAYAPFLARLTHAPTLTELKTHDEHTGLLVQSLNNSYLKHQFLTSLARDPVTFTQRWIRSQRQDLECVLGEEGRLAGEGSGWREKGTGKWRELEAEGLREVVALMAAKGPGGGKGAGAGGGRGQ